MQPWVDYKHQCSDDPNDLKIEVGTINAVGIRAANSCGNSKSPIVPGRLTVFVRAMTLKEKMDL